MYWNPVLSRTSKRMFSTRPLRNRRRAQAFPLTITQERHKSVYNAEPKVPNANINTHFAEMKAFVECIRDGKEPLVTGEHGLMVAQVMDGIYRSAEEGRESRLIGCSGMVFRYWVLT